MLRRLIEHQELCAGPASLMDTIFIDNSEPGRRWGRWILGNVYSMFYRK